MTLVLLKLLSTMRYVLFAEDKSHYLARYIIQFDTFLSSCSEEADRKKSKHITGDKLYISNDPHTHPRETMFF